MNSDFIGPVNIGSDEMVTINQLVDFAAKAAGKTLTRTYKLDAPQGVRGRNSDNNLIQQKLEWAPNFSLERGVKLTYDWINDQINKKPTDLDMLRAMEDCGTQPSLHSYIEHRSATMFS